MQNAPKDWLVRTRTGEILGPYTQNQLIEEIQKRTFSSEDEIAPSQGYWISAQTLAHHEAGEFTHTSTRSQAAPKSYSLNVPQAKPPTTATPDFDDLTPTPDFISNRTPHVPPTSPSAPHVPEPQVKESRASFPKNLLPIVLGVLVLLTLLALLLKFRGTSDSSTTPTAAPTNRVGEGESPFVRQIFQLIHRGETQNALRQLTQYHERGPAKGDVEYLIPYAALLILEKESPVRAKKMLEQVLLSDASPQLKSRAHHWLGYLSLSQGEDDMGEGHFLEALQLNTKDPSARFNLGRAYQEQEKYSQALDYLQLAELEVPDLWLVHMYKGSARVQLKNPEEARNSFKSALQHSPDRWIIYVYYALFLKGNREEEAAQNVMRRMLTRDPAFELQSPPPFGYYYEKANYNYYLTAYDRIMEKGNGEDRELGKLYINYLMNGPAGNEGKKIETYAEKGSVLAKVLALKVALDRESTGEDLRNATRRLPENLTAIGYYAYYLRGEARSRMGMAAEAQADFQKALSMEPKAAIVHLGLYHHFKRLHRPSDAQAALQHLLTYHPDYIPAIVSAQN